MCVMLWNLCKRSMQLSSKWSSEKAACTVVLVAQVFICTNFARLSPFVDIGDVRMRITWLYKHVPAVCLYSATDDSSVFG
eukprot:m.129997 g.129997  ORF g.129997 m.129997 type:complete len:80 (-) comp17462_c0_seq32:2114-2353(-)